MTTLVGVLLYVVYLRYFGAKINDESNQSTKNAKANKHNKNRRAAQTGNNSKSKGKKHSTKKVLSNNPLDFKQFINIKNENSSLIAVYRAHTKDITNVSWTTHNGENILISASLDGHLYLWKLPSHTSHTSNNNNKSKILITAKAIYDQICPRHGYYSVLNSNISGNNDTNYIIALNGRRNILSILKQNDDNIKNPINLTQINSIDYKHNQIVPNFISIHPLGKYFGITSNNSKDSNIYFYNPSNLNKMDQISFKNDNNNNNNSVNNVMFTLSPDGNYCAISRSNNTLEIFEAVWHKPTQDDIKAGKYDYSDINKTFFNNWQHYTTIKNCHSSSRPITCVVFTNDARFVISGIFYVFDIF